MQDAITLFAMICKEALPYGVTFALGEMIVCMFMKMAFGGKLSIGV